ncbi:MAG TPA: polysaccharide pyruvyl transferase family protein [Acidimicrobiales bacterium]
MGVFGLLGSGNLGNDASFEVVLDYLRARHPEVVVDAMCMGSEQLSSRYGIDAVAMSWYHRYEGRVSGPPAAALKVLGKAIDALRTVLWVRRHEVVIVPGMGVLEASLPLRASGVPYALFLLCASGRLLGTEVALVSVGAGPIHQRATRWLFDSAARLAAYRSYRDEQSRTAMRDRGLDTSLDHVFPDLVFGLPLPAGIPTDSGTVGVGVMAYHGGNDDRRQGHDIHVRYVRAMESFVGWLVDRGYRVRLFWGDRDDGAVAAKILARVYEERPQLGPATVVAEPFSSLRALIDEIAPMGAFVGTRYHNVLSALRLCIPTISVGYSGKFDALMSDMGVSEFCLSARSVDVNQLEERFGELERRAPELRATLGERDAAKTRHHEEQLARLSSMLLGAEAAGSGVAPLPPSGRRIARTTATEARPSPFPERAA